MSEAIKNEIRKTFSDLDKSAQDVPQALLAQPATFFKKMDVNFENFFYQRPYNYTNFNLYLKVLAEQKRLDLLAPTIEKMNLLKINFNQSTYAGIINVYARCGKIQEAENTLKDAILKRITPTNGMYTSLLNAYTQNGDVISADKIFKEMQEKQVTIDAAVYTSLIYVNQKASNYKKCWEIFEKAQLAGQVDQYLLSYMIRICSYVFFLAILLKK